MGADLYVEDVFQPQYQAWSKKFDRALQQFHHAVDAPDKDRLDQEVDHCYFQMYAAGYFRDSYNDYCLLWQYGLSWWEDVIPLLDEQNYLTPANAEVFTHLLKERRGTFEQNLAALTKELQTYFRERAAKLNAFLAEAARKSHAIKCSL